MQLILHIGTEKTATTTLQRFLYQNRDTLLHNGYGLSNVLGRPNNRVLPAYCQPKARLDGFFSQRGITTDEERKTYFKGFEKRFAREIERTSQSCHSMILTSEHLHSRLLDTASLKRLKAVLDPHFSQIRIIGYFREQASLCQSLFSSAVRTGGVSDIDVIASNCQPDNPVYNYNRMMGKWADVFGEESLELQLFDRKEFHDGDICRDFLKVISPGLLEPAFDYTVDSKNFALGRIGVELNRRNLAVNPMVREDDTNNPVYWAVLAALRDTELSQMGQLSLPDADAIYQSFQRSNRSFARRFLDRQDNPFAPPVPASKASTPAAVPTEVLLTFWEGLMSQLATLPVLSPRQALTLRDIATQVQNGSSLTETEQHALASIAAHAVGMAPHTLKDQKQTRRR